MASYRSISGELADLMRRADLDTDMRPVARLRRNTVVMEYPQSILTSPAMVRPEIETPTDNFGFQLHPSISKEAYHRYMDSFGDDLDRQMVRWSHVIKEDDMIDYSSSRHIKRITRKGIPEELRGQIWVEFSGAASLCERYPTVYGEVSSNLTTPRMFELEIGQIFVNNTRFEALQIQSALDDSRTISARQALARILLVIGRRRLLDVIPTPLTVICATMLMITRDELRTFWIMVALLTESKLIPRDSNVVTFFATGMKDSAVEAGVLVELLEGKQERLADHLSRIDLVSPVSAWFSSLFIEHLPFDTVLRVLDAYFWEGAKVLLRVGLALFKLNKAALLAVNDPFELSQMIRELPRKHLDQSELMRVAFDGIGSMSSDSIHKVRVRRECRWLSVPRDPTKLIRGIHLNDDPFDEYYGSIPEEPAAQMMARPMPSIQSIPISTHVRLASVEMQSILAASPPRGQRRSLCLVQPVVLESLPEESFREE